MEKAARDAEISISDLTHQGDGIGRLSDGSVVFVPAALPGDRVRIRVLERRRSHCRGELVAVVEPSPDRRRPPCILADHCGGCSLQPLDDQAQARWKEQLVRQTLERLGQLQAPLRPILSSPKPLGYRNRAVIPLERTAEGVLRCGYYRRGTHRIVNLNRCPVLDPRIDALIEPLKADLEASGWPIDRHGGGGLRHLALRIGEGSGEILITLVSSATDRLPGLEELAMAWRSRWPAVVGVSLNLQPEPTNRLFGERTITLGGRSWLEESFAGLSYRIGADSFFQINTRQAEAVVPLLHEALGPGPGTLVDAYCGIGTYALPMAAQGWRVEGIEQHAPAVELARANADRNGLGACRFVAADVAAVLPERLLRGDVDALLLDPPRKGLATAVLSGLIAAPPQRLAYLSCDPATLSRDLAQLCGEGPYRLDWLQPIDFFPNTSHVECLALMQRRP